MMFYLSNAPLGAHIKTERKQTTERKKKEITRERNNK